MVFLLSGVIITQKTFIAAASASELLNLTWQLVVLYIVLHVIRGISILSMSYILQNSGYGFDFSKGIVLWWSGLRGAVGLALGLMIENSTQIDGQVRRSMMFFVAGIAFFTLLINGVTMSGLIQVLRLDRGSNASKNAFFSAIQNLKAFWRDEVDSLVKREMYEGAFKDDINRFIPVVDQDGLDALETNCKNLEDAEVYELKGFINSVEERFENKRVPILDLVELAESENFVHLKTILLGSGSQRGDNDDDEEEEDGGGSGGGGGAAGLLRMITGIPAPNQRASGSDDIESQKAAVAMLRKRELLNRELKKKGPKPGRARTRARAKKKTLNRARAFTETENDKINEEKYAQIEEGIEVLREARYRYLALVRASYAHSFERGAVSSTPSFTFLQNAIDLAIDCTDEIQAPEPGELQLDGFDLDAGDHCLTFVFEHDIRRRSFTSKHIAPLNEWAYLEADVEIPTWIKMLKDSTCMFVAGWRVLNGGALASKDFFVGCSIKTNSPSFHPHPTLPHPSLHDSHRF